MKYELWRHEGIAISETFITVGEMYDYYREKLHPDAKLIWTMEAENYDEAFEYFRKYLRTNSHKHSSYTDPD
jgi:hypothetical protein